MITPVNQFHASSQLVKPVTVFLGCLAEDLLVSRGLLFTVNLSKDTYSPLSILAAYLLGKGGEHGTEILFSLAFAREGRWLVRFLCVCLRRCLWADSESVIDSELEEDVASVDVLELLLENRRH